MTPAERFTIQNKYKVPTWPAPNSARIDPAYRWVISTPNCVPRASRYFFTGAPNGFDIGQVGIIDMFPSGGMLMNGQTPINPDGRQVFLECSGFAPPDVGPQGVPGMYVTFLWTRVGFTPTRATYWNVLPWLGPPQHDMGPSQTNFGIPDTHRWNLQVDQLGENPDFDAFWSTNFGWKTISACNLDLPGTPVVDDLFAEFNGIDSYISLDQLMTGFNSSFIMSARIRLHDTTVFWPILGREGTGGFFGMDDADLIFGTLRLATSWTPVLDEWFDWRYEFEQSLQLKHQLFINDIEVMNRTTNRQFSTFDNLGVYKHGVSGTLWGNFDMQNLRITSGVPPSPILVGDWPLTVNALDIGPSANHGTPFNMDLPAS
jgi:hypothetical protein